MIFFFLLLLDVAKRISRLRAAGERSLDRNHRSGEKFAGAARHHIQQQWHIRPSTDGRSESLSPLPSYLLLYRQIETSPNVF